MKRIEIGYRAKVAKLEGAEKALERATKNLEKKLAKAEKLGVKDWTKKDHLDWMETVETENGWISAKADQDKNGAYIDMIMAKDQKEEAEANLEKSKRSLESAEKALEAHKAEIEQIEDAQRKEALLQRDFEEEQKEWAKEGIELKDRYSGFTPKGKRFMIYANTGNEERSLHCYTLNIDGRTVFTSGEFWRCYMEIKRG